MTRQEERDRLYDLLKSTIGLIERLIANYETESSEDEQWIGTGDAALLMGVSPQTIRNWVKMGVIKGKSLSQRKYVVYKPDVQAYGKNINEQGGKDSLYHIL